jgi:hypothetical protein
VHLKGDAIVSTDGLQLHPSHAPLLQERQRILSQLDQARSRARRLDELGAGLPPGGHDGGTAVSEINDPPAAVDRAVAQLELAVGQIERHRGEVRSLEQDIAAIKSRAQNTMILLVVAAIGILLGLFVVISAFR